MASVQFGPNPARLIVKLAQDADFVQFVRIPPTDAKGRPTDPWPDDQAIELRWIKASGDPPIVWTAAIDPDDDHLMGWNIDKAEVNPVLNLFRTNQLVAARWFIGDLYQGKGTIQDVT
jgi:hypothetical protein